ncbi:MAG: hypothetical protein U1F43_04865 [Myxococcota bacterium]
MVMSVPWPDPSQDPPRGWAALAWGAPAPSDLARDGRAFGVPVRVEVVAELGAVVLVRLTPAPRASDACAAIDEGALAYAGYRRVDEGLWALGDGGTRIEADVLDQTITLTEEP